MEEIGARMPKMATDHICITNPSPYPTLLQKRDSCQELLGCWPAFPINIHYHNWGDLDLSHDEDNVFAALEHPNRVCLLQLYIGAPQLAKLATVMREPFPVLTTLRLSLNHSDEPCLVIPSGFLGGSAPCLQELHLGAVLLQGLPPAGYISPEGMVACLAALTRLEYLYIQTDTSNSLPYRIDAAPKTRIVLPALTSIRFGNVCNYVEDLMARIDCPRFNTIRLKYFNTFIYVQVSQVFKFINDSEDPWLAPFSRVYIEFHNDGFTLKVSHKHHYIFEGDGWRVWNVVQFFSQFSATLSNVRHLFLFAVKHPELRETDWVQFLYPFTTLQTLRLWGSCSHCVVDKEMADGFLPALDLICIKDNPVSCVAGFCAVRQLSGRPIAIVGTKEEFNERLKSYPSE